MKTKLRVLLTAMAVFAAGGALAKNEYDLNTPRNDSGTVITNSSNTGHFSADILVHPINGAFDDLVRFNTADLRSLSSDLHGSSNGSTFTWEVVDLYQGLDKVGSFAGGSSDRHGEYSGGDSGFFMLHLKGHVDNSDSGDYHVTVSAVPEPETYAMLLAGLGLVGAVTRRRKRKSI